MNFGINLTNQIPAQQTSRLDTVTIRIGTRISAIPNQILHGQNFSPLTYIGVWTASALVESVDPAEPLPIDTAGRPVAQVIPIGVAGKPNLFNVAERIGLRIQEVDAEEFDGTLVQALDGPKGIIGVKQSIRELSRKRFTIAHEIGHYIIPGHRTLENVCGADVVESWRKGLNNFELEANEFAVELLLPAQYVRDPLKLDDPSLSTISQVASQFETSLTATTLRFVGLTDLPCAAVWSQGKRAKWYRRSEAFPFYLSKEVLPCEGSMAYRLFEGQDAPNDFVEVPLESWLDQRDTPKALRVVENSLRLPYYDAVLTLLWFELRALVDEEESPNLEDLDPEDFTLRRKRWPR